MTLMLVAAGMALRSVTRGGARPEPEKLVSSGPD